MIFIILCHFKSEKHLGRGVSWNSKGGQLKDGIKGWEAGSKGKKYWAVLLAKLHCYIVHVYKYVTTTKYVA